MDYIAQSLITSVSILATQNLQEEIPRLEETKTNLYHGQKRFIGRGGGRMKYKRLALNADPYSRSWKKDQYSSVSYRIIIYSSPTYGGRNMCFSDNMDFSTSWKHFRLWTTR